MSEEEKKIAYLKVYYASLYKIIGNIDLILKQEKDGLSYKVGTLIRNQLDAARRIHGEVEKFLERYFPDEYRKYEETIEKLQMPKQPKLVI